MQSDQSNQCCGAKLISGVYLVVALFNTQNPIGQIASNAYVIMFALRTAIFTLCAEYSFSISTDTKYSDHQDAKKNGTKRTNPAAGIIQYISDSYGINQAACSVTDSTLPSVVSSPKAPPPPASIWIRTSNSQVKGMPTIVETRLEIVVVLNALGTASSSCLLRNIASMIIIGIIDNPSAGITKKIMGTPAFADAAPGIHMSMHNVSCDFTLE